MTTAEQDVEKVKPVAVDIFDQSLATTEVEVNPDGNAFSFPPPPSEKGNPYRVKLERGDKGWQQYPGKAGKDGYLVTDIKATIIAPGVEGVDGKILFDNFISTMVMAQTRTSRVQGVLKAIYDTRGQGEKVPSKTSHQEMAQLLDKELMAESECGVWIQWEAYCEACSTEKNRKVVRGEKRFPMNGDNTGHLGEIEHKDCGSNISAKAQITRYLQV